MNRGKLIFITGLLFAMLFFLTAPKSHVTKYLQNCCLNNIDFYNTIFGIVGLIFVYIGYVVYQFDTHPRYLAIYNIAYITSILVWISITNIVREHYFEDYGITGLFVSMTLTFPFLLLTYMVVLRRLKRKAIKSFIIFYRIEKKNREE